MTKSKMEQYAKGWKHPDVRTAERRDNPPPLTKKPKAAKPSKGC